MSVEPRAVAWEIRGDAHSPALLLVPPLGRDRTSWNEQIRGLEESFQCIVFDPRGIGQSKSGAADSYSAETIAQDAARVLDRAELGRAHVVGWSLGAAAASVLALHDPGRVASLTLLTPWARTDTHLATAFRLLRDLVAQTSAESAELATLWLILSRQAINAAGDQLLAGARSDVVAPGYPTPETLCSYLDSAIAFDVVDELGSITVPTLVVGGADDKLVDVSHAREVATAIPGARLHVMEGEGATHALVSERSDEVTQLLKEFAASSQEQRRTQARSRT